MPDAKKDVKTGAKSQQRDGSPAKGKKAAFSHTAKRVMREDIIGEGSPGPGAYLPASTFAKASAFDKKKKGSSSFRSGSSQRPKFMNEHVPGAGAYTPSFQSIEKNKTNPGASLGSKNGRFDAASSMNLAASETGQLGPGAYEVSHYKSLKESTARSVRMSSKNSPGFGRGAGRLLPHEMALDDDEKAYRSLSADKIRLLEKQDQDMKARQNWRQNQSSSGEKSSASKTLSSKQVVEKMGASR